MPKILWVSPFSLHDTTSGAAVDARYMLKALQKRGYEIWVLSAFIFDAKRGSVQAFGDLDKMFAQDPNSLFIFDEDNIHYIYTRTAQTAEQLMSMLESQLFYSTFCQILDEYAPELVMGYGLSPAPQACFAEAKHRGISTTYVLTNGDCGNFSFPNIDLILTVSQAMAKLYADRDEINLHPIGSFYDPKDFVAPEHKKEYVTMINPAGHKGVAIFAKLAQVCQKEMPEVKFLTVNMREHFKDALTKLHEKNDPHRFPYTLQDFPNVFMLDPQKDMRLVYAVTSVLVVPSLWFEAWGRVATEAIYNNIPVMCSKSGGLTEACAGGGLSLDVPEHCKRDYGSLPTDEEIKPWVQGLKDLLNHKYDQKVEVARQELVKLNAPDRLIEAITPLIQQTQRNRKQQGYNIESFIKQLNSLSNADLLKQ